MPKVRLILEDLSIESFVATPAAGTARGTVRGLAFGEEEAGTSPRCEDTPLASCDSCEERCQPAGEGWPWNAR
ncbi:MAG TPA: hypothetical protein VFR81_16325 [Longimicrobium sp.]|nr:hypothetical protein [Longimicrobium sp.]